MPVKFYNYLGLTSTEFKLLLFVVISFIFGLTLNQLFNISNKSELLTFDYSLQDSLFFSGEDNYDKNLTESGQSNIAYKQEVLDFNSSNFSKISKKVLPPEKSINLNLATKSQLMNLPGIGEKTAAAIIQYREKVGKFRKLEELKKVKGIGEKKFEKIIKYIYL